MAHTKVKRLLIVLTLCLVLIALLLGWYFLCRPASFEAFLKRGEWMTEDKPDLYRRSQKVDSAYYLQMDEYDTWSGQLSYYMGDLHYYYDGHWWYYIIDHASGRICRGYLIRVDTAGDATLWKASYHGWATSKETDAQTLRTPNKSPFPPHCTAVGGSVRRRLNSIRNFHKSAKMGGAFFMYFSR